MDFEAQLEHLVNEFQRGLKQGFSLQFLVQKNIALIEPLLRGQRNKGPLSLKALSHKLGVNVYSLKTAISRVEKACDSEVVANLDDQQRQQVQLPASPKVVIPSLSANQSLQNEMKVLEADQPISATDMAFLNTHKPFLYATSSGVFLMSFKFQNESLMVFDAVADKGQSQLRKTIKFDIERKLFC